MDTKTRVVGQDVYMLKPPYPFWFCIDEGKVVKVTPTGGDAKLPAGTSISSAKRHPLAGRAESIGP